MKVFFDHIAGFGKVSNLEVIVNCAYGILEPNESSIDALKQGWIPWKDKWYNERSTRIDLSKYQPSKTTKKIARRIIVESGNIDASLEQYIELHEKYCTYHGFKRDINLDNFKDCSVIEYYTDHLVGISIYKQFDTQFVAYQFIWDYEDPKSYFDVDMRKPRPGRHILHMVNFSNEWINTANHGLVASLERREILFPRPIDVADLAKKKPAEAERLESVEEQIQETKREVINIIMKQTPKGFPTWDTPRAMIPGKILVDWCVPLISPSMG